MSTPTPPPRWMSPRRIISQLLLPRFRDRNEAAAILNRWVYDGRVRSRPAPLRGVLRQETMNALSYLRLDFEYDADDVRRLLGGGDASATRRKAHKADSEAASLKAFSIAQEKPVRRHLGPHASHFAIAREIAHRWDSKTGLSARPDTIARHLRNDRRANT